MPYRSAARAAAIRTRGPFVALAVTAVVVGLTGCGSSTAGAVRHHSPTTTRAPRASTTTTQPPLPVAPVQWAPCGDLQCGSVTVPLNYADPDGPTIQIAVARHPAEDPSHRIGSLVINPGGPGTSGIDDLPNELSVLTPELLERFDIVSFDPRGVDRSSPVSCTGGGSGGGGSGGGGSGWLGWRRLGRWLRWWQLGGPIDPVPTTRPSARPCSATTRSSPPVPGVSSGAVLPYVGTVDTARDLDRIREALGDARLTFIGQLLRHAARRHLCRAVPDPRAGHGARRGHRPGPEHRGLRRRAGRQPRVRAHGLLRLVCRRHQLCRGARPATRRRRSWTSSERSQTRPLSVTGGGTAGPGELYDTLLAGLESQSSWPTAGRRPGRSAEPGNGAPVAPTSPAATRPVARPTGPKPNRPSTASTTRSTATRRAIRPWPRSSGRSAPVFGPLLAWGLLGCATVAGPAHPDPGTGDGSGRAAHPGGRAPPATRSPPTSGRWTWPGS